MSPPCCPRHLIPITPSTDEVDAQRKEAIKAKVGAGVPHAGRWEQAQGEGQGGCDVQNRSFLSVIQLGVGLVLLRPWWWELGRVGAAALPQLLASHRWLSMCPGPRSSKPSCPPAIRLCCARDPPPATCSEVGLPPLLSPAWGNKSSRFGSMPFTPSFVPCPRDGPGQATPPGCPGSGCCCRGQGLYPVRGGGRWSQQGSWRNPGPSLTSLMMSPMSAGGGSWRGAGCPGLVPAQPGGAAAVAGR